MGWIERKESVSPTDTDVGRMWDRMKSDVWVSIHLFISSFAEVERSHKRMEKGREETIIMVWLPRWLTDRRKKGKNRKRRRKKYWTQIRETFRHTRATCCSNSSERNGGVWECYLPSKKRETLLHLPFKKNDSPRVVLVRDEWKE